MRRNLIRKILVIFPVLAGVIFLSLPAVSVADDSDSFSVEDSQDEGVSGDLTKANEMPAFVENGPTDYVQGKFGKKPQIVVFGDSQFDRDRTSSGLASRLAIYTHSQVFNCAMGGSMASSSNDNNGIVDIAEVIQNIKNPIDVFTSVFPYYAYNGCDLSKTDIFIIEYGINDYMNDVPIWGNDRYSYYGALDSGIKMLKESFPLSSFIITGPSECEIVDDDGNIIGNGCNASNSYGTVEDYAKAAQAVAQVNGIIYADIYSLTKESNPESGKNLKLDRDGVHFSDFGKEAVSRKLSKISISLLGYDSIIVDTTIALINGISLYEVSRMIEYPYNSDFFNAYDYYALNPDVRIIIGTNPDDLFIHYVCTGMNENRIAHY